MSREFTYTVKKSITEEELRDIIIDGIENSIIYWAFLNNDTSEFERLYDKGLTTSEAVAEIVLTGGEVEITDNEGDVEPEYKLTLDRLIRGIELNAIERPHDCDLENYDVITCDCIFQYAIFNEVIFG